MKKLSISSSVSLQTLGMAIAVVTALAACSTLISLAVVSSQPQQPLFAEIQRMSSRLDAINHQKRERETRLESIDIRLTEVNEVVNALADAVINNMMKGVVSDMKLMAGREEHQQYPMGDVENEDVVPLENETME